MFFCVNLYLKTTNLPLTKTKIYLMCWDEPSCLLLMSSYQCSLLALSTVIQKHFLRWHF